MRNRGFTLVELMVVIGIVAILALLAVPTYQDKFIRDQIAEALPLADIAKPPVAASWALLQSFPANNAAAGLPVADNIVNNYISSVAIEGGAVNITFGNKANGAIRGKIYNVPSMPTSYIVDRTGIVRHIHTGYEEGEDTKVAEEVKALLK